MKTPEQKQAYQKKYQKAYRLERKLALEARVRGFVMQPILRNRLRKKNKTILKATGMGEITCSEFSCGRILSITEQLFGNKCIHHSIKL